MALGSRQLTTAHNNQPNLHGIDGKRIGEDARLSGNAGGWYSIAPGVVEVGGGIKIK